MSARTTWSQLPKKLKILLASMILANIGSRVYRPFLPLYLVSLGASVSIVGFFFTYDTIAAAILRPFGGWVSDSIGRLQTVGIGTVFGLLGMFGYAVAPSFAWMLVATTSLSLGRAMVGPSFRAYTAEVAPDGGMAQTFGVVNGVFSVVDIIGPLLGGLVAAVFDLQNVFWVAVGFMAAATTLRVIVALNQPYRWQLLRFSGLKSGFSTMFLAAIGGGLLTWLLITDSLRDIGVSLYQNFEPLLLQDFGLNEAQIGLVFSLFALVYAFSSIFGSRVADSWSAAGALAVGGIVQVGAIGLLAFYQNIPATLTYFVISGLAFGVADPAFDALLAESAPSGHMGMTFGLFRTAISFAAMPAPFIGGLLWENVSPLMPFEVGAVFLLFAAVLSWVVLKPQAEAVSQAAVQPSVD